MQDLPPKVPPHLHTRVQILLALIEWDPHLPDLLQDPLDQGSIPEDLLCRVDRPCHLDRHVARHRCQVSPRWTLRVYHQDPTASILTCHLIHLDNLLWTCSTHGPLALQSQG